LQQLLHLGVNLLNVHQVACNYEGGDRGLGLVLGLVLVLVV